MMSEQVVLAHSEPSLTTALTAAVRNPVSHDDFDPKTALVRRVVSSLTVRCGTLRYACGAVGTAGRGS
jgi:hypothetical protein